jgi:hypothetical protein
LKPNHQESIEYDPETMTSDQYAAVHRASVRGPYKNRFNFADENRDQALSAEEFCVYKYPEHSKRAQEYHTLESAEYIQLHDANKDFKLTQKELDAAKEGVDAHVFASYDTNSDGFLDKFEISKMHFPDVSDVKTHIQKVDDEILFLLQHISTSDHGETDDPKTIRVSREECHKHQEYFVHQVNTFLGLHKEKESEEDELEDVEDKVEL